MPSSMCWPLGENSQLKVEGMRSLLNGVGQLLAREQAAPVDPGAEIGRDRDVGRGGDDALGEIASSRRRELVAAVAPKPCCVDITGWIGDRQVRRHRDAVRVAGARLALRERHAIEKRARARVRRRASPSNVSHSWPGRTFIAARKRLHLRRRHQAGMIVLVAGERQAEALDRVGDEADRPVVVDWRRRRRAAPAGRGRRDWSSAGQARRRERASISARDGALVADIVE